MWLLYTTCCYYCRCPLLLICNCTHTHQTTKNLQKLYIILIRPERNVRQSMMPVRYSAMDKSGTAPTSMMATIMVTAATCNQNERLERQATIFAAGDASKNQIPNIGNKRIKCYFCSFASFFSWDFCFCWLCLYIRCSCICMDRLPFCTLYVRC